MEMTLQELQYQERCNTGSSWTRNIPFENNGYLVCPKLWDPEELACPVPEVTGQLNYSGKNPNQFNHNPVESQVQGSTARYWHPQYRQIHSGIRLKLEGIIGRKLYNTYYFDRFYYAGQELGKHADRAACEISVSVHIGTNLPKPYCDWPFKIKTPDTYTDKTKREIISYGVERSLVLRPGDGLLYKGCERPHWRDPLEVPRRRKRDILLRKPEPRWYYHQIFFHYVLPMGLECYAGQRKII